MTEPPRDRFNPNDPAVQILLLAQRVENLGKEKEQIECDLEKEKVARQKHEATFELRMAKMERTMTMGWGVVAVIPVLGGLIGFIALYAKLIFAPWINSK